MNLNLQDLILLRDAGVAVSADEFLETLVFENTHRDFSPCGECGTETWGQHDMDCPRATVLWEPDWFERAGSAA